MQHIIVLILVISVFPSLHPATTTHSPKHSRRHASKNNKIGGYSVHLGYSQQVQDIVNQLADQIRAQIDTQFEQEAQYQQDDHDNDDHDNDDDEQQTNSFTVLDHQVRLAQGTSYNIVVQDNSDSIQYTVIIYHPFNEQPQLQSVHRIHKSQAKKLKKNRRNRRKRSSRHKH